jgi:hypothetical protein
MVIWFGKHRGKSIEDLVVTEPDYALWVLAQEGAAGPLAEARREVSRVLRQFDESPILRPCKGPSCTRAATRCSLYHGSATPYWWCDSCDPAQECCSPGKLSIIRTYGDSVQYVSLYCGGRKGDLRVLIKQMARAKKFNAR